MILGVKEVPGDQLLPGKTYMFFSHTIKAQPYNMRMLDVILEKVRPARFDPIGVQKGEMEFSANICVLACFI